MAVNTSPAHVRVRTTGPASVPVSLRINGTFHIVELNPRVSLLDGVMGRCSVLAREA